MRYDYILFDADGTLWDFEAAEAAALENTLLSFGFNFNKEILRLYTAINKEQWELFERGLTTQERLKAERFRILFEKIGIAFEPDRFAEQYTLELANGNQLTDGAEEICRALYGRCHLSIVTNGISYTQHRRFDACSLKPYISDLFVSGDMGCQKPQKEYFDLVFGRLGIADRSRTLIVGDSLSSDIRGGVDAGIDTCWYNPTGAPGRGGIPITYEISTLDQLQKIVE